MTSIINSSLGNQLLSRTPLLLQTTTNITNRTPSQVMINHNQVAGYKKKQSTRIVHVPDFTEYDKLPGDQYQAVYYGYYDGERHCDPRAKDRFYRLNWGGWIRARGGRGSNSWQKTGERMWWSKQHILCSERQCEQLEKMFEQKYRKETYFVDDPYEIYEERNNIEFLPIGRKPHSYSYMSSKDLND